MVGAFVEGTRIVDCRAVSVECMRRDGCEGAIQTMFHWAARQWLDASFALGKASVLYDLHEPEPAKATLAIARAGYRVTGSRVGATG